MKLVNAMEHSVKEHLKQLRSDPAFGDETCWCPLCRADMLALTLTALPPRYATRRPIAPEAAAQGVDLKAEAARAVRHVGRFPKHERGAAVAAEAPVWVVNFPLEESFRAVDALIRSQDGICDCWNCRCDMVAFALNRYPARYGVEHEGRTHLLEQERARMRADLEGFLDLALRVVATVPRHDFSTAGV